MVKVIGVCDNFPDTICFYQEAFSRLGESHSGVVYRSPFDIHAQWQAGHEAKIPALLIVENANVLGEAIFIQDLYEQFGRDVVSKIPVLLTGDTNNFNRNSIKQANQYLKGLTPDFK